MKIQGVSIGDNGIRNIEDNKTLKAASKKQNTAVDSVKISEDVRGVESAAGVSYTVNVEFPPRIDLIKTVSERVSNDDYNTPEMINNIAGKIIESSTIKDVLTEFAVESADISMNRAEKVEIVNDQLKEGYYEDPEILIEIADRLIDVLGFSSLLKQK